MTRRSIAWLVVLASAAMVARARGETRAAYGGVAQVALPSAPTTLDPLHGGLADGELAALVYDTPFVVADGKPRPSLATSLALGDTRARLTLRGDVRFSDGTPLTARDVAASITRALGEPGGWTLAPIKSARAVADDAVELELTRPTPELPLLLATPAAMVTPGGAAPQKRAVGSGPFVVDAWDASGARLSPNASAFAGRPYLSSLVLRAFASRADESGSFELGALQAARQAGGSEARRAASVVEGPQTITGFVAVARGPDAALFRRALALGVNRERLRRLTVRDPAVAAAGAVPPALGGAAGKAAYDPARAKSEIEARFGAARPHLGLLVDGSRAEDRDVAERVLADLARVGIDVAIESVDAAQYQARLEAGKFDLVVGAARPPAPDATLAAWALIATVDAAAARTALARSPSPPVDLETSRVVPLFHRAARVRAAAELRGLRVDFAGRAGWADAWWLAR